jgi:2-methylcitrate dehydratase PrpD
MTKPLHVGHAVRNGVFAALMVKEGFTANAEAFEHRQGFLDVFNGAGTYDTGRMLKDWYAPFEIEGGEAGVKQYPCCGSTHASVARAIDLATRYDLDPADIQRVEVMPHARRLPHTDNPDPRSPLAAKFSIQYCVARALADRAVRLEHFEGAAPFDPAVRSLMARIEARAHPGMAEDAAQQWGAEVVVTTTDGRRLSSRADEQERRGPGARPMTQDELWEKFQDCARRSLPHTQAASLFDSLMRVDSIGDAAQITRFMETNKGPLAVRAA